MTSQKDFDEADEIAPKDFNAHIVRKRAREYYNTGGWNTKKGVSKIVMQSYYRGAIDQFRADQDVMIPILDELDSLKTALESERAKNAKVKSVCDKILYQGDKAAIAQDSIWHELFLELKNTLKESGDE